MDVISQLMGQVVNGFSKVPAMPQTKTGETASFDSMIRDKYQQADGQKTQEQPEAEQNTDVSTSKPADSAETEQPKEQITDSAEAESQPTKVEDMKQQYELAAALMMQAQPVAQDVQPQVTAEEVQVEAAVGTVETVIPLQEQQNVAEKFPEVVD